MAAEVTYVEHPRLNPSVIERRAYQIDLIEQARADHTLVCLPTGLGKTTISLLITADRLDEPWKKSLFLAPTKPLVEQHAAFYREALQIDDDEIVVFTGEIPPAKRADAWTDARIVIATPQVIENDLIGGRIDLEPVVHLTVDECHRASGDYPYTFIAERYHATAQDPLVTAMSASPGGTTEDILEVCSNLGLESVAVKTDQDADVTPYTYETELTWETVELPDEIIEIRDALQSVIRDRLEELKDIGVSRTTDPELSQTDLNRMRGKLQSLIDGGNPAGYKGMSYHAEVMKLKRAVEVAETQSIEAVRRYFERQTESARSSGASKATQRMIADPRVQRAIAAAEAFDDTHPKFSQARIRLARTLGIEGGERAIVFTESRDTAEVLTEFLGTSFDVRRFVGQGDREGNDGMTQREQHEVLEAFRAGEFNVLVSTSVAEEGLDVPEVDLVLFFEPVPTAIRAIQRRGRTGRHAPGKVVVLMAEGTRDEAYFWIARRREDKMVDQLESLKGIEGELEASLGGRQSSLTTSPSPASNGEGSAESSPSGGQAGLMDFEPDGDTPAAPKPDDDDNDETVTIVADQRELDSTIGRQLSAMDGIQVSLETLDVGDYILSDRVAVERKTVTDFLDSLLDGERSLFQQVGDLADNYDRPIVIVEGGDVLSERDVHPNAVRGALASLAVDFHASVLFTQDATDTAALLAIIAEREQQRSGGRTPSTHGVKGGRTIAEQQEYVISSIADIGPITARGLLEELGSVEAVMTANQAELQSVSGVGEITANRIRDVVGSAYDPS